jgi:hypothetical protein
MIKTHPTVDSTVIWSKGLMPFVHMYIYGDPCNKQITPVICLIRSCLSTDYHWALQEIATSLSRLNVHAVDFIIILPPQLARSTGCYPPTYRLGILVRVTGLPFLGKNHQTYQASIFNAQLAVLRLYYYSRTAYSVPRPPVSTHVNRAQIQGCLNTLKLIFNA